MTVSAIRKQIEPSAFGQILTLVVKLFFAVRFFFAMVLVLVRCVAQPHADYTRRRATGRERPLP